MRSCGSRACAPWPARRRLTQLEDGKYDDRRNHPARGAQFDSTLELSLVLESMGIPHEVRATSEERWVVAVRGEDAAKAEAVLAAWERENAPRPVARRKPDYGPSLSGVITALALLAFTVFVSRGPRARFIGSGSADAGLIVSGEWWRAATALTLHADAGHAAGNAVALGLFLTALAQRFGPALASWLALFAGIAGNLATAVVTGGNHGRWEHRRPSSAPSARSARSRCQAGALG